MPEDTAADGRGGDPADGEDGGGGPAEPGTASGDPEATGGSTETGNTASAVGASGGEQTETATDQAERDGREEASATADRNVAETASEASEEVNPETAEDSSTGNAAQEASPEQADQDQERNPESRPEDAGSPESDEESPLEEAELPPDVSQYARFTKVDGSRYERVNDFLRDRTYITAREWAIARLCADFRTETGVEMTKIGENLPELVPFMTDTYTPQAVNQARAAFEEKVRMAGATFLYGAMCDFFTAEELDDLIYEVTEVAKFLLEVEGVDLAVEDELETEDRISEVMREVRTASEALRNGPVECPECGHDVSPEHLDTEE
jgi:hypothetical protein